MLLESEAKVIPATWMRAKIERMCQSGLVQSDSGSKSRKSRKWTFQWESSGRMLPTLSSKSWLWDFKKWISPQYAKSPFHLPNSSRECWIWEAPTSPTASKSVRVPSDHYDWCPSFNLKLSISRPWKLCSLSIWYQSTVVVGKVRPTSTSCPFELKDLVV